VLDFKGLHTEAFVFSSLKAAFDSVIDSAGSFGSLRATAHEASCKGKL
jgi:hypothetical protein